MGKWLVDLVKIIYSMCLVVLWVGLGIEIGECFRKYMSFPTYYETSIVPQHEAEFPDITVCSNEFGGLKGEVLEGNGLNKTCYFGVYGDTKCEQMTWTPELDSPLKISSRDIFHLAAFNLTELVSSIRVHTKHDNMQSNVINPDGITDLTKMIPKEQRSFQNGKCYTLRFTDTIKAQEISSVEIMKKDIGRDIFVSLNSKDTFYNLDTRKDFVLQDSSVQYYVDYQDKREMERIKEGVKTCKDRDYDQECVYQKFDEEIRASTSTSCNVPWAKNNTNICTKSEDVKLALVIVKNITTQGVQECLKVCHSMPMVFTGGDAHGKPGKKPAIKLFFQPVVSQSIEKYLYTLLNLFAEVGGYVGIMVGYSLLSFAEYLYERFKIK